MSKEGKIIFLEIVISQKKAGRSVSLCGPFKIPARDSLESKKFIVKLIGVSELRHSERDLQKY